MAGRRPAVARVRQTRLRGIRRRIGVAPLTGLEMLQAAVAILIAVVVGIGALLASAANGDRQDAVREEIKRSAATIEDVRLVYGDEAPLAFRIAIARLRTEELRRAAEQAGPDGSAAAVEAVVQEQVAFRLATGEEGTGRLADGNRYQTDEGGFDVARRLADVRSDYPDLVALNPDASQADADGLGRTAWMLAASTAVMVLAYLVVALLWHRRTKRSDVSASSNVEVIPQPWQARAGRREATTVALLVWILATLLPWPELYFADQEQHSQTLAARNAARISTVLAATGLQEGFVGDSRRAQLTVELGSLARELGVLDAPTEDVASQQRVIAAADRAVAPRLDAVRRAMTDLPDARDGVDPATRAALASSPVEWKALQVEQSRQADLADRASQRSDRMVLAALLSALAASLAALAAASAIPSPSRLWAAVALLVGGLVATATALFG